MTYDEDHDEYKCSDCGEIANIIQEDIGIGHYEFWGAPGFDSQIITITDCCSSEDFEPYYEEDEISELDNPLPPVVL